MKTIVVCASKKYAREVTLFCTELRKLGVVVFEPNISDPIPEGAFFTTEHLTKIIFKGLTLEHFDWIRKADTCFIYNKNNYVGISVTMEMGFASALGKPIFALVDKTGDPCRDALIDKVAKTPKELLKILK